jgi:hypothetical protein
MKKIFISIHSQAALALTVATTLPTFAFAAPQNVKEVAGLIVSLIKDGIIPVIAALTLMYFIWGIFLLVRSNSEDTRKEAIAIITFGIIALFVMVSVWGLVSILTSTFFGGMSMPQLR